jgi:transposase
MARHHSKEFRKETVRLVIQSGKTVKQVAEELGINYWTLKEWVKKYGRDEQGNLIASGLKMSPEEENKILRRELADTKEERDILKKAIAVFSKKPKISMFL